MYCSDRDRMPNFTDLRTYEEPLTVTHPLTAVAVDGARGVNTLHKTANTTHMTQLRVAKRDVSEIRNAIFSIKKLDIPIFQETQLKH